MIDRALAAEVLAATSSSKVRRMSSIIACSAPAPAGASGPSSTGDGSLESRSTPRAGASRRAGSMVSTTVSRPSSAARRATAAAVVVLPTPPAPVHTTTRVAGSASRSAMSRRRAMSAHPLVDEHGGEVVEVGHVHPVGQGGQHHGRAARLGERVAGGELTAGDARVLDRLHQEPLQVLVVVGLVPGLPEPGEDGLGVDLLGGDPLQSVVVEVPGLRPV